MTAYNKVKDQDDRLDAAASLMGWHRDDWSSADEIELDENDLPVIKSVDMEDIGNMDPCHNPSTSQSTSLQTPYFILTSILGTIHEAIKHPMNPIWPGDIV